MSSEGNEMLALEIFLYCLLLSFLYDRILTFSVMEFRDEADALVFDGDFVVL
jgi:hypothetical protein